MNTTDFAEAVVDASPVAAENLSQEVLESAMPDNRFEAFSAEDIAKAREQEKAKLYPQVERLKEEIAILKRDREEREAQEAALRAEQEAEAKRRAEEDMDVRELLSAKEQEWQAQLEAERQERERAIALLERERQFSELQAYRNARLEEERDNIIPELVDLINGDTPEEIENSIASLRERSERILRSAQEAMTSARRDLTGTRITTPAAGPLDTNSENRMFTAEDVSNMSMSEYQKYRDRLLGNAASNRSRGLFG